MPDHQNALRPGTRLGEFKILDVIGVGGFGIVYRALDLDLEREVAIKEYMPGQFAGRDATGAISVQANTHAETFGIGLRSFVNEARLLARFDHPALVKVHRYWEANRTAYMAMPYYKGRTLGQTLRTLDRPPDQAWLRGVLDPVLDALALLHGQQIYHRDISPDNIMLLQDGAPILLDFGAARQVLSDRTQLLTAILKPHYAPIEQYADVPGLKQGPWTDLYALGAVVYACLSGKPPSPAATRGVVDDLQALQLLGEQLRQRHGLQYEPSFLDAWQAALNVRPSDRPQSVAELRELMAARQPGASTPTPPTPPDPPLATTADNDRTVVIVPDAPPRPRPDKPAVEDHDATVVLATGGQPRSTAAVAPSPAPAQPLTADQVPTSSRSGSPWLMIGIAAALVAAVGGFWALRAPSADAGIDARNSAAAASASALALPASAAQAGPPETATAASAQAPAAAAAATSEAQPTAASGAVATRSATAGASTAKAAAVGAAPASNQQASASVKSSAAGSTSTAALAKPAAARNPASSTGWRDGGGPSSAKTQAPATIATPGAPPSAAPATAKPSPPPEVHANPAQPAPTAPPAAAMATATDQCGKRILLANFLCMRRECARPELAGKPDCQEFFKQQNAATDRSNQ
ncbi:MAG: hypothetical protein RIQ60_2791 [Pseudomonadota bacterium]|jgi:serine/threonine protein kinase